MKEEKIYTVMIVDDEPPAREIIRNLLSLHPYLQLVAEASNGFDALKLLQEHKPDILFLDIQMPKITGLELLEVVDEQPKVIFTTAFDHFAIKAFELNAIDYLLKPFSPDRFHSAIAKAIHSIDERISLKPQAELNQLVTANKTIDRVVVKSGSQIVMLGLDDIYAFEAQDDFAIIYARQGKFLKSTTLKHFEDHLPEKNFLRVHRSFIVNLNQIQKLEAYEKESWIAVLNNGIKVKVSRSGYKRLKELLQM